MCVRETREKERERRRATASDNTGFTNRRMGVVHKVVRTARTASLENKMAVVNSRTPPHPAASSPSTSATASATPAAGTTATSASKYPRFGRRGAPQVSAVDRRSCGCFLYVGETGLFFQLFFCC